MPRLEDLGQDGLDDDGLPLTIEAAATALRSGSTTSSDLFEAFSERADRIDPLLGVYLSRASDDGLRSARLADERLRLADGDDPSPVLGVPIGVKDNLAMIGYPTTAQSLVLGTRWGGWDADSVGRLRTLGAVLTGKLSLSELAVGWPDPDKPFPVPRNPWDTSAWTGGSSAGSAAGIAAGLFLGALGSDTGGSIRIPAAFCGVSGLKPTRDLISTHGCVPLAPTLDTVGPLARSAAGCRALLEALVVDPSRLSIAAQDRDRRSPDSPLAGLRVGVAYEQVGAGNVHESVVRRFDAMVALVCDLGATVIEVEIPLYDAVRAANLIVIQVEAFARYRTKLRDQWTSFFSHTRQILSTGALIAAHEYAVALQICGVAQERLDRAFSFVDLILTPTMTTAAPRFDSRCRFDGEDLFSHVHTSYWNCVANPALAIPMGFDDSGMPLSLQVSGRPYEDSLVLRFGEVIQSVTDWHLRRPSQAASRPREPGAGERHPDTTDQIAEYVASSLGREGLPASKVERLEIRHAYAQHLRSARALERAAAEDGVVDLSE